MKKINVTIFAVLVGLLFPLAKADEIFYATAYTGVQGAGSSIDLSSSGPLLQWTDVTVFHSEFMGEIIFGSIPRPSPQIGDTGAYLEGIASTWNLGFTNWGAGTGYATIVIDTNHPPGAYAVGTVNCTGAVIWVVLQ